MRKIMKGMMALSILLMGCANETPTTDTEKEHALDVSETKDTTPPNIYKYEEEITVEVGDEIDYASYFDASDESPYAFKFDDSNVNLNKAGTYTLGVTALDDQGNEATMETKIIVKEKDRSGYYFTNYTMYIRNEPSKDSSSVGWVKDDMQVLVQETITCEDGSVWAKLSTGYMCIFDKDTEYLSKNTDPNREYLNPLDFESSQAYHDYACPSAQVGGVFGPGVYEGNVNMTMGCSEVSVNLWIVY